LHEERHRACQLGYMPNAYHINVLTKTLNNSGWNLEGWASPVLRTGIPSTSSLVKDGEQLPHLPISLAVWYVGRVAKIPSAAR
jgi:hypothetical protein